MPIYESTDLTSFCLKRRPGAQRRGLSAVRPGGDDLRGLGDRYVWFDRGNNISSFNTAAPGTVYNHTGAPEVFKRNGIYYLLFSSAWYNSQYAMYYIMGNQIVIP